MDDDHPEKPFDRPSDDRTAEHMAGPPVDIAEVQGMNRAFYAAFESQDFDAMSDLWAHDDDVACTHPGWETLHGWAQVASSWIGLFQAEMSLQIIVTNERVRVVGDVGWVTVDENLLDHDANYMAGNTIAAVNVFHRRDSRWQMVLHHGSSIVDATPVNWQEL